MLEDLADPERRDALGEPVHVGGEDGQAGLDRFEVFVGRGPVVVADGQERHDCGCARGEVFGDLVGGGERHEMDPVAYAVGGGQRLEFIGVGAFAAGADREVDAGEVFECHDGVVDAAVVAQAAGVDEEGGVVVDGEEVADGEGLAGFGQVADRRVGHQRRGFGEAVLVAEEFGDGLAHGDRGVDRRHRFGFKRGETLGDVRVLAGQPVDVFAGVVEEAHLLALGLLQFRHFGAHGQQVDVGDDQVRVEFGDHVAQRLRHDGHVRERGAPVERGVGVVRLGEGLSGPGDKPFRGPHDPLVGLFDHRAGRLFDGGDRLRDHPRGAAAQREVEDLAHDPVEDRRRFGPRRSWRPVLGFGLAQLVGDAGDDALVGDAGAEADHRDLVAGGQQCQCVALGAGVDLDVVR